MNIPSEILVVAASLTRSRTGKPVACLRRNSSGSPTERRMKKEASAGIRPTRNMPRQPMSGSNNGVINAAASTTRLPAEPDIGRGARPLRSGPGFGNERHADAELAAETQSRDRAIGDEIPIALREGGKAGENREDQDRQTQHAHAAVSVGEHPEDKAADDRADERERRQRRAGGRAKTKIPRDRAQHEAEDQKIDPVHRVPDGGSGERLAAVASRRCSVRGGDLVCDAHLIFLASLKTARVRWRAQFARQRLIHQALKAAFTRGGKRREFTFTASVVVARPGERLEHADDLGAHTRVLDRGECTIETDALSRRDEVENLILAGAPALRLSACPVEEIRNRHFQEIGDRLQSAGADAIHSLFVFLHLLEGHAKRVAQRLLADPEHHSFVADTRSDMPIYRLRLLWAGHGSNLH